MTELTEEECAELRGRVGVELYADGCSYYYGLRPDEVRGLLDTIDALRAEVAELNASYEAWAERGNFDPNDPRDDLPWER